MSLASHSQFTVTVSPGRGGCSSFLGMSDFSVSILSPASWQIPGEWFYSDHFSILSPEILHSIHTEKKHPCSDFSPHRLRAYCSPLLSGLHKSMTLGSTFKESFFKSYSRNVFLFCFVFFWVQFRTVLYLNRNTGFFSTSPEAFLF